MARQFDNPIDEILDLIYDLFLTDEFQYAGTPTAIANYEHIQAAMKHLTVIRCSMFPIPVKAEHADVHV